MTIWYILCSFGTFCRFCYRGPRKIWQCRPKMFEQVPQYIRCFGKHPVKSLPDSHHKQSTYVGTYVINFKGTILQE
jgi:hypothetical protein